MKPYSFVHESGYPDADVASRHLEDALNMTVVGEMSGKKLNIYTDAPKHDVSQLMKELGYKLNDE